MMIPLQNLPKFQPHNSFLQNSKTKQYLHQNTELITESVVTLKNEPFLNTYIRKAAFIKQKQTTIHDYVCIFLPSKLCLSIRK